MSWALAVLFKPLLTFIFMLVFVLPIKLAFQRFLPEGKLKDILFTRLN